MPGGAGYQYQGPPASQGGRPGSGGFDGPGEPSRGPNPFGQGLGYDPAKPPPTKQPFKVITNTRVELPPDAYRVEGPAVSLGFSWILCSPLVVCASGMRMPGLSLKI